MTETMMDLRALVEKTPGADLLREMIGFAAEIGRFLALRLDGPRDRSVGRRLSAAVGLPAQNGVLLGKVPIAAMQLRRRAGATAGQQKNQSTNGRTTMRTARGLAAAALAGAVALGGLISTAQAQEAVRIGTSSVGGVFYVIAVGLSEMLSEHAGINATVEPVGGSHANMFSLQADRVDLAIVNSGAAYDGYHGAEPFEAPVDVRLLGQGQESYRYFLVRRDSGITEPGDLAGKTFIGSRPSLPELELLLNAVAEANDVPVSDINVVSTVTTGDSDKELRAGTVAGAIVPGGPRMPTVSQLFQDDVVDFLYLPEEQVREIVTRLPQYFFARNLPAGHYAGQEREVTLFGLKALLVGDAEMSEDTAYAITKTIFDNPEQFSTFHAAARQWTTDNSLDAPPIPFHPGAIRYFQEQGVWTDELEARQQELLNRPT